MFVVISGYKTGLCVDELSSMNKGDIDPWSMSGANLSNSSEQTKVMAISKAKGDTCC